MPRRLNKIWRFALLTGIGRKRSNVSGEAGKPIIYYLDNGTPEPVRSALLDGARWVEPGFEEHGV